MSTESLVGQNFEGRYVIEAELGQGGYGAVYRARQLPLGRSVAIKVLHPDLTEDPSQVVRFQREAQAIAALTNPHTVKLIDFGVAEEGQLFMVMEFLEGETLRARLRRNGALSPAEAVRILHEVAECLAEAHSLGIVHRDIKPENLFLARAGGRDDFIKVLDFGIARLADDAGVLTSLTRAGATIGSPHYMAPEQATANKAQIGPATDIYAMGILGYELVTGTVPFGGTNVTSVLIAQVQEQPVWPVAPGGGVVPAPLARLIMQCLAKAPFGRPNHGAALLEALRALPIDDDWQKDRFDAVASLETDESPPVSDLDPDAAMPTLPIAVAVLSVKSGPDEMGPTVESAITLDWDAVKVETDDSPGTRAGGYSTAEPSAPPRGLSKKGRALIFASFLVLGLAVGWVFARL